MPAKRIVAPTLLAILFTALLIQLPLAIADRTSVYEWFDPIQDVRAILLRDFVSPPDEHALQQAAIDGMIRSLEDPYTEYVSPQDFAEFTKQLRGTYAGIGAEVNFENGHLVIVSPMDDSPALRAGVLAGDIVLEIEGESTFEKDSAQYRRKLNWAIEQLTGEAKTPVTIRVRHLDGSEEQLTIIRDQIITRTVKGIRRLGDEWSYCVNDALGINYIRITQFNDDTVDELQAALEHMQTFGLNGLVLDLRDNPGGGLPTAIRMADLFLDEGVIVSVRPRVGEEHSYSAEAPGTLPRFPMVVLVNGNSASASEIIAGALQDHGRAKVLGTRTFGKGSVQEVRPLKYGSGTLKFTTAHYHRPSGRNINRSPGNLVWGVDPDPGMVVPVEFDDYVRRIEARRDFEVIRSGAAHDETCFPTEWIRANLADEQLALAVTALEQRLRGEEWPTLSEDEADIAAVSADLARALNDRAHLIELLNANEQRVSELQSMGKEVGREPLLPENADLTEGTLTLRDRSGAIIGVYRIEGGDIELALETIALERIDREAESAGNTVPQ